MKGEMEQEPPAARPARNGPGVARALTGASKAAVSAVLAVVCSEWLGLAQPVWAAVSAVVVTQPSLHPSARDSFTRVVANLIGAVVGGALGVLAGRSLWALAAGIVLTGLACHLARLDTALRPAYAAVVIVILSTRGGGWQESMDRVFAVILGCAATLAVGLVYDKCARRPLTARAGAESPRDQTE
jgi:uncharacterized membrane protein YgaE (UPF0421/DUF939 family)